MGTALLRDSLKVGFTPDVIQLDILRSETSKSLFHNFPGVINVSEVAHKGYLVTLDKNLVKDYISDLRILHCRPLKSSSKEHRFVEVQMLHMPNCQLRRRHGRAKERDIKGFTAIYDPGRLHRSPYNIYNR